MNGYELCHHLSEQLFGAIGGYFANFSSSVGSIGEETYCQQAAYFSYNLRIWFLKFDVVQASIKINL
jgi:hypothetical protein